MHLCLRENIYIHIGTKPTTFNAPLSYEHNDYSPVTHQPCCVVLRFFAGYYADVEARCQVFRVCANTDLTGRGFPFLCPNGTLFNQRYFVCDWYNNVNCAESEQFYEQNTGKVIHNHNDMMQMVKTMQDYTLSDAFMAASTNTEPTPTQPTTPAAETTTFPPPPPPPPPLLIVTTTTIPPPTTLTTVLQFVAPEELPQPNIAAINSFGDPETNGNAVTEDETRIGNVAPQNGFQIGGGGIPEPPQQAILPPLLPPPSPASPSRDATAATSSSHNMFGNENVANPAKIYVSSLGELSTDLNSGFDINKSRFLVPSSDSLPAQPSAMTTSTLAPPKERLFEDQVALIAHSINENGLTANPDQINNALLSDVILQHTTTRAPTILPRLISSDIIVPLPKGFNNGIAKNSITNNNNYHRFMPPTLSRKHPARNQAGTSTTNAVQYPVQQFSFPATSIDAVGGRLTSTSFLQPLPVTAPLTPPPPPPPPLTMPVDSLQHQDNENANNVHRHSHNEANNQHQQQGVDESVNVEQRLSSATIQEQHQRQHQEQHQEQLQQRGSNNQANSNEKQIFTYPVAKSPVSSFELCSR